MYQLLISLDRSLFFFLNSLPHTPFLDALGLVFSFLGAFGMVWFLLAFLIMLRERCCDRRFAFAMILSGVLSAMFVSFVFKPLLHRDRPDIRLGGRAIVVTTTIFFETFNDAYAFPSGHTTIAFASAFILAKKRPKSRAWFYALASMIAFTRIYLGKHYPFDVVAGIILGLMIGWSSWQITSLRTKKAPDRRNF